jgi:hypothetical protein
MALLMINLKSTADVPKLSIHKKKRYGGQFIEHCLTKHTYNIENLSPALADRQTSNPLPSEQAHWET